MSTQPSSERVETVVIGAGQSGLAVGHHLAARDRSFVILDANERVGDNWRCHWDSLRLYSAARHDGLPGLPFPGPPGAFPGKDEVADYLESYTAHHKLPVRTGVRVLAVRRAGEGYLVDCGEYALEAANVVVATGTFGRAPSVPAFAAELDPAILQLHSSAYRNPAQLPSGPVLVVGASHSGADLAYELATTGRRTYLCGRINGQIPFRIEGPFGRPGFRIVLAVGGNVLHVRTPVGRKVRAKARAHGAPLLRQRRADLEAAGVEYLPERTTGTLDGRPVLDGGRVLEVASVVWCTGFRQDFGWIELPVFGDDGWPLERRGVVDAAPGLYFTGLAFQSSFRSMLMAGAAADAEFVVRHLVRR
ncbi:MAG: NAD(P)/FAD-dependent oxidoreductase, partial [Actinomycetia bacterium]|nr:NAD(P)/FAD-dependent oxidoreductase [Actinomycetes bacterium]